MTGQGQDGCYLDHTRDCAGGISREHYISEVALEQLSAPAVAIDGVPWLAPGERKIIGINNLTANISVRPSQFRTVAARRRSGALLANDQTHSRQLGYAVVVTEKADLHCQR
jgi:hypothetical protein